MEELTCLTSKSFFLTLVHRLRNKKGILDITWLLLFHVRNWRLREVSRLAQGHTATQGPLPQIPVLIHLPDFCVTVCSPEDSYAVTLENGN